MDHPSNSSSVVGVDNTHRMRFNQKDYAKSRQEEEDRARKHSKSRAPPVQRKPLKSRDYIVYLESLLEKLRMQKTDEERLLTEQDLEERDNVVTEEEEEEEAEMLMDPEVQAVVGFGGFSSSNR